MSIANPVQKTKKEIWLAHKKEAWALRQRCWTQERIGEHLGISQAAVSKLLARACEEYQKRYTNSVDKIKSQQINQLERIADEAMQAWEKSCTDRKSQTVKKEIPFTQEMVEFANKFLKKNGNTNITQYVEERCGDPRYLQVAMKAKEDIRKITGADAPTRVINEDSPNNAYYKEALAKAATMEEAQEAYQRMLEIGKGCQNSTTK